MKLYSVKEMAQLAHVTIKTLRHYHKIGLLIPCEISPAGYRYYGQPELERLQEILFYRELGFPLQEIKTALQTQTERGKILARQRKLLTERIRHLHRVVDTLDAALQAESQGEKMADSELFKGLNETQWNEALSEQADYLKETYDFDLLKEQPVQAAEMNEMAQEVIQFQNALAAALRDGISYQDETVQQRIADHIAFLRAHGHEVNARSHAAQVQFLVSDDFHRQMFEASQTGLAYYLLAAASHFADQAKDQG
jgi:DNA-binding transcriptional MerR regulator